MGRGELQKASTDDEQGTGGGCGAGVDAVTGVCRGVCAAAGEDEEGGGRAEQDRRTSEATGGDRAITAS